MRLPPQFDFRTRTARTAPAAINPSQERSYLPAGVEHLDAICYHNCVIECYSIVSQLVRCDTLCRAGCTVVHH